MSNKWTCPGCQSNTSRIYDVFVGEFENCPNCGLSGDAMREIHAARQSHASEQIKSKFEELTLRAGRAEAELVSANRKLERIRAFFGHFNWERIETGNDYGD